MSFLIAIQAVDIIVWAIRKVGWVHLVFALGASETLAMVATRLGNLLLSFKHLSLAAWAHILLTFFSL